MQERTIFAPLALLAISLGACGSGDPAPDGGASAPFDGAIDAAPRDAGEVDATVPSDGSSDASLPSDGGPIPDAPDGGAVVGEVVVTDRGPVRGAATDDDLVVFLGIPFAAPPVGALRFRAPEPHPGWSDVLDATAFGPPCSQRDRDGTVGSEDCLHLNVWAHAGTVAEPRPVMVFVHGGGFTTGQSSLPLFDGAELARLGGAVVITIQYRLGALGYLATEALAADSADGSVGNFGLLDQIAALAWIERNVASFGGDPSAVTVIGESAGAVSICALLGTERADGLFARAILESGGGCFGFQDPRVDDGRPSMITRGETLVADVGCSGASEVACLRGLLPRADGTSLTAEEIVLAQPMRPDELYDTSLVGSLELAPNIDGVILREQPIERLRRGDVDVPIVVGANRDDARAFTATTVIVLRSGFESRVRDLLGTTLGDAVIPLYDGFGPNQAWSTFLTDLAFSCPTLSLAEATSLGEPTWIYQFERVMEGTWGALGATHAIELFFVFGNFPASYDPAPEDLAVEAHVQGAWTSFARRDAPALTPAWPTYDAAAPRFAILDEPTSIATELRDGRCAEMQRLDLVP